MAATSPWSALYFVALIIFGKHVLLNVLVGIVVKSYQAKVGISALVLHTVNNPTATCFIIE